MKLKSLFCSLIVLLPLGVSAKEAQKVDLKAIKHPVKPLLWKIEGKGLEKPSYLFGTIHISDPRVTNLHPLAQQAFDQADAVYTEIDLSPQNQLKALPFYLRKDDKTLDELIGADLTESLNTEVKAINPALNSAGFQKLQIWAVAFSLPQLKSQLANKKPLDMQLWERASAAKKKTAGLETFEQQLGKFDQFTREEQIELLDVTLKTLKLAREKGENPYQTIVDAYLTADIAALEREMTRESYLGLKINPKIQKKILNLILNERNKVMANTIQGALANPQSGSCFFAAGTLHYVGEKSVNGLLTEAGYTVSLVK